MTDTPLPWGWLNAASTPRIDELDDVELERSEIIAFWAIAHNFADDAVPCNAHTSDGYTPSECERPGYWTYRHSCGRQVFHCTPHKVSADLWAAQDDLACYECGEDVASPIPWLPL